MTKRNRGREHPARKTTKAAEVRVKTIEAGELRLTDSAGRVRAMLEIGPVGPRLVMMHEDGTVALELVLANDGPSARLADESGNTRVFIGANRGSARFGMADGAGSQRVFIGVGSRGTPTVSLYDQHQRQEWTARGSRPERAADKSPAKARGRTPKK